MHQILLKRFSHEHRHIAVLLNSLELHLAMELLRNAKRGFIIGKELQLFSHIASLMFCQQTVSITLAELRLSSKRMRNRCRAWCVSSAIDPSPFVKKPR